MTSLLTRWDAPASAVRRLRRHRWWPLIAAAAVLLVVLVLGWVVFWSPYLVVRTITVEGASVVPNERVLRVAGLQTGMPLVQVDAADIERRLTALDEIAAVDVTRSWSGTVTVQIHETKPVAAMHDGDQFVLIAFDGTWLRTLPQRPVELPLVDHSASGLELDPSARAALEVATALPPALRHRVDTVSASSPSLVTVELRNGTTVTWGSAVATPAKADTVLLLLGSDPRARAYDVSAPQDPAVVR